MHCSSLFKTISGYLHGLAIVVIAIFSAVQIYDIKAGKRSKYWVPLGIAIMMALRLPNVLCIALVEPHGWYVFIGSIIALITNAYITHLLIKYE
tara:strand:- start:1897 stop:2178 length:282 start_codon:yes stop_codon:yes gene_type:complete